MFTPNLLLSDGYHRRESEFVGPQPYRQVFSNSRQRLSRFFSSTSWRECFNSFCFINIVERRKSDIFSTFVFNNLMQFNLIFHPLFFHDPGQLGID